MGEHEQWYTNKDLFEKINAMRIEFQELRQEMQETREIIKRYNGLRQELYEIQTEIQRMKAKECGKSAIAKAIREWGGWIVAILALLANVFLK